MERALGIIILLLTSTAVAVFLLPSGLGGSTAGTNYPRGIHLSYLDDPTSAVLTWYTNSPSTSRAEWGIIPGPPYAYAAAGTDYYSPGLTNLHTVTLTGLVPGTRYYYRVGDSTMSNRYGEATFRAAPAKGATDPFTFAAAGDWGDSTTTKNTALGIGARKPDLVLPIGDHYYSDTEDHVKKVFDKWQPFGESGFEQAAMGNHEYTGDRYDTPTAIHCAFVNLPGNERTYAYTFGDTFFMTVDWGFLSDDQSDGVDASGPSCGGTAGTAAIRAWMTDQLTAANLNSKIQWKVVYQHFLCYGISDSSYNNFALCPNNLGVADQAEDIFVKQKVDLVLEAHDHKYGRTYPVKFGTPVQTGSTYNDPQAPLYVLLGTGGAPNTGVCRTNSWIAACRAPTQTAGFGWFSVSPTTINYQFVENTAGIIDAFSLTKPVVTDYNVTLDPASGRMGLNETFNTTVSVRGVSADPVALSVSGCPTATVCSLSTVSGNPGFQSTLSITTSPQTPFGVYPIAVSGSNSTVTRSGILNLTVSSRQIRTYTKGDGGAFSETDDAYIYSGAATSNFGSDMIVRVDGDCTLSGTICRGLVKFPNLIGSSLGQIPVGSSIVGADLTVSVTNPSNGLQELYRLTETWSESTVSWNGFATPGSPANAGLGASFTPVSLGLWKVNVTSIVQAWANGEVNQGILISSKNSDGAEYQSSESAKPPILSVTYDPPLAPMPFDFAVIVLPTGGTVNPGVSAFANATVALKSGATQPVQLRCDNLPAGASCAFNPGSANPSFGSKITIGTSASTPLGQYAISVVGTNGSIQHAATFNLSVIAPSATTTVSFRQGDGGAFSGTNDTYIYSGGTTTNYGREIKMITDGDCSVSGTICRSLLKFPDIVGSSAGQIPVGSTIVSAELTLSVTNPSNGAQEMYRVTEAWSEYTVTWNTFGTPGWPTNAGLAFTFVPSTIGLWKLNVTSLVQSWAGGSPNQGIMISSVSGDGANYESKESANHPLLKVTFLAPSGPSPFDFSVSLDATKATVAPGGSSMANATLLLKSGSTQTVQLQCPNLPLGASCTFGTPSGSPTFVSALTIATSSNTPLGTYAIWVSASNGTLTRQVEYDLTVATAPSQNVVTLTFRKGDGGAYSETDDAYIYSGGATTNYGTPTNIRVDADCFLSGTVCKGLIKFPNFIGSLPGQVPLGATIMSATIDFTITNPGSTQYGWQVTEAWTEAGVTWNSFATPGSPLTKGSAITFSSPLGAITVNVTAFVANWIAGDANHGILFTTLSGDGVDYSTSESASPPKLTVIFQPPAVTTAAVSMESEEHGPEVIVDATPDALATTAPSLLLSLPWAPVAILAMGIASRVSLGGREALNQVNESRPRPYARRPRK